MHATVDIKFDELLKIVKNLPGSKLSELGAEIEKDNVQNINREEFRDLLLSGTAFSKEQLVYVAKTRKAINQLRIK